MRLRPIAPDDASGLIDFHSRLSDESRYYRFFGPKPRLTASEAKYLAEVDHLTRFALIAESADGEIIGVARFDIGPDGVAEPAIVVEDSWQHQGLGRAMLDELRAIGRKHGVRRYNAEILAENNRMLELLSATPVEMQTGEGVVTVGGNLEENAIERVLAIVAKFFGVANRQ